MPVKHGSLSPEAGKLPHQGPPSVQERAEWKLLYDASPLGMFSMDTDLRFVRVNKWLANFSGLHAEKHIGRSVREVIPQMADWVESASRRVLETGKPVLNHAATLAAGPHPDRIRHLSSSFYPLESEDGSLRGVSAILRDVTKQKQAEEDSRKSERQLRSIIDAADTLPISIAYLDPDLRYKFTNAAYRRLAGQPGDELVGRCARDVLGESVFDRVRPCMEAALSGDQVEFEDDAPIPNDGDRTVHAIYLPHFAESGEVLGFYAVITDLGERRRLEESLHLIAAETGKVVADDFFRSLVQHLAGALKVHCAFVCRIDDWDVTRAHVLAVWSGDQFDAPFEFDIRGTPCEQVHANDLTSFPCDLQKHFPGDEWAKRAGAESYISVPLFDSKGRAVGHLGVMDNGPMETDVPGEFLLRNFAARASAELERSRADREIQAYQQRLRSLAAEAALVEERERRRIATELHDRTTQSLAFTQIKLGALREALNEPRDLAALDEIRTELDRAIEATRSLTLDLSPPMLHELGFEPALEWLADQFAEKHGLEIDVRLEPGPTPVSEDIRAFLFQVVRECLVNVVKHARARRVELTSRADPTTIQITVQDDGIGFDVAATLRLTSRTIGFGLFSIRERLGFFGGQLEIESTPASGTKVSIAAPLEVQ